MRGRPVDGVLVRQLDAGGMAEEATLLLRPLRALQDAVESLRAALAEDPLPRTGEHDSEPSGTRSTRTRLRPIAAGT